MSVIYIRTGAKKMSINKAIIIGRLGQDPKQKDEGSLCTFSVATSEKVKGESKTEWHEIVVFGKTADVCAQYLSKGSEVYVEGKIRYSTFTAKDGSEKRKTEIIADRVEFLSKREVRNDTHSVSGAAQSYNIDFDDIPF